MTLHGIQCHRPTLGISDHLEPLLNKLCFALRDSFNSIKMVTPIDDRISSNSIPFLHEILTLSLPNQEKNPNIRNPHILIIETKRSHTPPYK